MLLLNIEYIPGKKIEALGIAKGSVVQSKNFGKDFMAGMKTLVGGEIEIYSFVSKNAIPKKKVGINKPKTYNPLFRPMFFSFSYSV